MFNDILRLERVDPETVLLARHGDQRANLYEIWRTDPPLLERYQAIQKNDVFDVGDRLASFVRSLSWSRVSAYGSTSSGPSISTVIATSLLIPFELYELVLHPTVWKAGGILINLLIVLYLASSLRRRLAR